MKDFSNLDKLTYVIIDSHTGAIVSKPYKGKDRNRARARAERLDQAYGAARYSARPIYPDSQV